MLGLAFASAAYAKLTDGGFAWITSGAVKYHFIDDAASAPLTWGLWVAAHPPAAVLLSLGAILTEACFISMIFVRSPWYRLLLGGVGLSLTVGFYVFQGVLWPAWLMLFTALLPWPLLDRGAEAPALASNTAPLRVRHVLLLAALAGQQALVSVAAVSVQPLLDDYPMYSHTFESPEAFDRTRRYGRLRAIAVDDQSTTTADPPEAGRATPLRVGGHRHQRARVRHPERSGDTPPCRRCHRGWRRSPSVSHDGAARGQARVRGALRRRPERRDCHGRPDHLRLATGAIPPVDPSTDCSRTAASHWSRSLMMVIDYSPPTARSRDTAHD